MSLEDSGILQIPLGKINGAILFFADEIPAECDDLIDALRSELAPFRVWKQCAVEYFKQGNGEAFEAVLNDIIQSLKVSEFLNKVYLQQPESVESLADIYLCLAAKEILSMFDTKYCDSNRLGNVTEMMRKCNEYFSLADETVKLYALSFILKGFYYLVLGDIGRAEESFASVHKRIVNAQDSSKRKYLYLSYIGSGMVHYAAGRYTQSAELFSKALVANPQCDPSLRSSLALCYYKLLQFEKCSLAAQRAISLESMDSTSLVLMGLVDLMEADKNYSKRKDLRRSAFECFSLANRLDPTNPVVWNLLANQYYHSWFPFECLSACSFMGNDTIVVNVRCPASVFVEGNLLKLSTFKQCFLIKSVTEYPSEENDGSQVFKIVVDDVFPDNVTHSEITQVNINNLFAASSLLENALKHSQSPSVRAETHFLVGKVKHQQKNLPAALDSYRSALKDKPDFPSAAFAVAEIQFLRKEYKVALEIFEKVLQQNPADKDTQAFVALLRGMLKNEQTALDKLKEIAINFQYELELWKVQAFVRHNHSGSDSLEEALRCYQSCMDCHSARELKVSSEVLNNVAQIYSQLNKPEKSIRLIRDAIIQSTGSQPYELPVELSREVEFEGLVSKWVETGCFFNGTISGFVGTFTVATGDVNELGLSARDEIVVGDLIMTVDDITDGVLTCSNPFWSKSINAQAMPVRKRIANQCFTASNIQYWFNYATYLEALRQFRAARVIFEALLAVHPSYDECHLRLASISRLMGNPAAALEILSRVSTTNNSRDFNLVRGDVLLLMGRTEEAKRSYEMGIDNNPNAKKDPTVLLSLGNLYMNAVDPKSSYKYYFSVLQDHVRNLYAANGLGIICAKKEEFESAKQIFNKIRQLAFGAEDMMLSLNLAHTFLMESKFVEAERLYMTTYKEDCRRSERDAAYSYAVLECAACAVFLLNRFDDAVKISSRVFHANVSKSSLANLSAVIERLAVHSLNRPGGVTKAFVSLLELSRHFLETPRLHNKSSHQSWPDRLKTLKIVISKLLPETDNNEEKVLGKRKLEE